MYNFFFNLRNAISMYMKKKKNNRNAVLGELMTQGADAYATGKKNRMRRHLRLSGESSKFHVDALPG